jgi:predicted dehydrogenase
MNEPLRWGILGTGNIARQFAAGLSSSQRGKIVAVGSRSADSASSFAAQFGPASAYGSYEALLNDRQVQAVYLSLPNSMHHEWTIKSLRAEKHVLCEKPFAISSRQAEEMFDVAQQARKVLIEAFMYRSHPQTLEVMSRIRSGAIGQVRLIRTSFCFRTNRIEGNIRFAPQLGGGALMDVGCYCLSLSRMVAGEEPGKVRAFAHLHSGGVDEMTSGILQFPSRACAEFTCGMRLHADNTAYICGDEGYVAIPVPWKPQAGKAHFVLARGIPPRQDSTRPPIAAPPEVVHVPCNQDIFSIEADAFAACVLDGAKPFVTRADTLGNIRAIEAVRAEAGLANA